jgi:hypothetical protein
MDKLFSLLSSGVSLGCNAWSASLVYIGVGLLTLALMPELSSALSQPNCNCPDGQVSVTVGEGCECQCTSSSE